MIPLLIGFFTSFIVGIFYPYFFINSLFLWFYYTRREINNLTFFLFLTSLLNDILYIKPLGFFLFIYSLSFLIVSLFFKFLNRESPFFFLIGLIIFNIIIFLFLDLSMSLMIRYFIINLLALLLPYLSVLLTLRIKM